MSNNSANSNKLNLREIILTYFILILIASILLFPILWLLSTAIKSPEENVFQYPPSFIPQHPTLDNLITVWQSNDFGNYLWNSTIIAFLTVLFNLVFCSLAAYPLARLKFPGRNLITALIVSTIMIPFQIVMIPLYMITLKLGLINSYLGMILPNIASAFGIFLLKQAMEGVPEELSEAGRLDGCTELGIWWSIIIPAIRPALVTLAIFVFIGAWSDFLWPLIILQDEQYYTLPLGVNKLASGAFGTNWRLVASGAVISILPVLTLFLLVQRYIVPTDVSSGVKG